MPDSEQRYLYERLGDNDFQQLVSALMTDAFPGYIPMALRQPDGGRDGLRTDEAGKLVVYQVKWSSKGREKNPVSWLEQVVKDEADNLRRLASEGVRRYVLVTNIASTAKQQSGTHDQLQKKFNGYAKDFGYEEMSCIWREQLNAFVDNAPLQTKWAYAEMLAGWELIRYLVAEQTGTAKDSKVRDLVRKVTATQWASDQRVKFSQSEVDREKVVDLFVDVNVERVHTAGPAQRLSRASPSLGGAAAYLVGASAAPFVLVRGAPGQGKSTLSQYVCQAYRAPFMPPEDVLGTLPPARIPLFPIRVDLSDYALWLDGNDIWDNTSDRKRSSSRARKGPQMTIEHFLADLLTHDSGKDSITADDVHDIFSRLPSLVVLDGLDEVGSTAARRRVVQQIDHFVARGKAYDVPPRLVVTTRPSGGALPEPSPEHFEIITLTPLTPEQRNSYLRKWCAVRNITGRDGRALRDGFKEKSREPYIGELAGNPMQLTILLDLLHRQGAATPTQRTELYDKYVELLLAREANKHPKVVKDHQRELEEIIPFLGWYLHAQTEKVQINGRMTVAELKAAMRHFQVANGNRESVVDKLFEGATDRLWTLTSKIDGTYEFEVLSLREYFAAQFLYRSAGEGDPDFDPAEVLHELLRRPYWRNTARFYGGNARGREIHALTAAVEEELADQASVQSVLAAWTLLTDGAFQRRPREARRVLTALCSDYGLPSLLKALATGEIIPLPQMPEPPGEGPDPTWERLTTQISDNPSDPANHSRVRVVRELLGQRSKFNAWWYENLSRAIGTPRQNEWLALGADHEAGAGTQAPFKLDLTDGAAEAFLSAGLVPTPGSALEAELLAAVLDGRCHNVTSVRSLPAQVAVALSPQTFFTNADDNFSDPILDVARRRSQAINNLGKARSPYAQIAKERTFRAGEKGSTFPWDRSATALYEYVGRCWLASEIAIIGAASPFRPAHTRKPDATAFGPTAHPSELLAQTRAHASDTSWWRDQLDQCHDDLAHAEWALALWSVASGEVVSALFTDLENVLRQLPPARADVVMRAAGSVTFSGWTAERPCTATASTEHLANLINFRNGNTRTIAEPATAAKTIRQPELEPLLSVARERQWFRVDTIPTYR